MPFRKRGRFYYHKGKKYTAKQVKLYYSSKGTWKYGKGKKKKKK